MLESLEYLRTCDIPLFCVLCVCADYRKGQCVIVVVVRIIAAVCSAVTAIWTVVIGEDIKGTSNVSHVLI